jgi:UDP-N-acetylglucosamine--N-acetylmuramyl-(pentapeptide) pyrophosphoryl-undecaprenol N-acetylglucosamine transferase
VSTILFTGGGTAGHVIPALPVIDACLARGDEVVFVGSRSGLEERLVGPLGVEYHGITTGKLRRYLSAENVVDAFRVVRGVWQAIAIMRRVRPDLVFSKGGFVAFPVVFAAWLARVPVIAHESDFSPGLANRLSLPFVELLCTSFSETRLTRFRGAVVHTGTPVRAELLQGDRDRGRAMLGIGAGRPVVVATGGSLGADALNAAVRAALPELVGQFEVVHACGPGKLEPATARAGYHQFEFVAAGWGDLLAAADVVVSRAGANALFELLALGKPMLLVPLTARASRGDQLENAAFARAHGYAQVLQEQDLEGASLTRAIESLYADAARWRTALARFERPPALERMLAAIDRVLGRAG